MARPLPARRFVLNRSHAFRLPVGVSTAILFVCVFAVAAAAATINGVLPGPLPLFRRTNWWNVDVSQAPVDPSSASFTSFIGTRGLHPDFGGVRSGDYISGMPYIVVDGNQPKKAVEFHYAAESDGVNHTTGQSVPFYPIPDGSDVFISGTFDERWDNDILNAAFRWLTANDFEVITRGWQPAATGLPSPPTDVRIVSE